MSIGKEPEDEIEEITVDELPTLALGELKEIAHDMEIPGYKKMSRDQLIAAILDFVEKEYEENEPEDEVPEDAKPFLRRLDLSEEDVKLITEALHVYMRATSFVSDVSDRINYLIHAIEAAK